MYDTYHRKLLGNDANFKPREGNRTIEIFQNENGAREILDAAIQEAAIGDWLDKSPHHDEFGDIILKLLICSPEAHLNDAVVLPLPISRDSYEILMAKWHLPTEFLRMLFSTMAIDAPFSVPPEKGESSTEGLLLRSGRSRDWNYCVAVTYSPKSATTCIIHGLEVHEIENLIDCIKCSVELSNHPMLIPIMLIELKIHRFAVLLEERDQGLDEIEYRTGMRHGFSKDPNRNPPLKVRLKLRNELDFDIITQQLTGLVGTFAFCDLTFVVGLRSLQLVETISQGLLNSTDRALPVPLERRIRYLKGLVIGAQATRSLLQQRTTAQVQAAYARVAQKDAEASLRDSADVRIITIMGLLFLPPAFVATFFSSAFFRFTPKDIWIYWIVAGGLTFLTLLTWFYFSKDQWQRLKDMMRKDAKDKTNNTKDAKDAKNATNVMEMGLLKKT